MCGGQAGPNDDDDGPLRPSADATLFLAETSSSIRASALRFFSLVKWKRDSQSFNGVST